MSQHQKKKWSNIAKRLNNQPAPGILCKLPNNVVCATENL